VKPDAAPDPNRAADLSAAPASVFGQAIDHFRVMRVLGRGGMGTVYLARDTLLGRKVALKVIKAEAVGSDRAINRLLEEARTTARFSHPNIVAIHAVGRHEGQPYLALEYLEGQTLRERMNERPSTVQETLRVGLAITTALIEAHSRGVLHRDLKPANIIIPSDGRLRVLDFGISKVLSTAPDSDSLTDVQASRRAGTPAYMAPEQWRADPCTPATDVWALGIILFQMLTGTNPFEEPLEEVVESEGDTTVDAPINSISSERLSLKDRLAQRRERVCGTSPAPRLEKFGDFPSELSDLLARCLQKKPEQRPNTDHIADVQRSLLNVERSPMNDEQSPFRGLLPFTRHHASFFHGREAEVSAFMERLRLATVLPVVGPSGAGKSSFVQAGVIPRLREQGDWLVLQLRPGAQPLHAIAGRLIRHNSMTASDPSEISDSEQDEHDAVHLALELSERPRALSLRLRKLAEEQKARVLLFVDQLEELFTHNANAEEREQFLAAICSASDDEHDPVRVIYTVRGDFIDQLAATREAHESLRNVTVLQPPGREALHSILENPLRGTGYRYEDDDLPRDMVAAVSAEPACLPLLQFAAQRLWENRDKNNKCLTRSSYEQMGGVVGALAQHADGVLEGFSATEQLLARELLLRLVTAQRTRRVVERARALEGLGDEADEVLSRLMGARLVTVRRQRRDGRSDAMLELAHESLIETWGSLSDWLRASQDELTFLAEIGQAAELWDRRGRRRNELWTGEALRDAQRKLDSCTTAVAQLSQTFLTESDTQAQRRLRQRRTLIAAALAALTVVAIVMTVQKREADFQRHQADVQRRQAQEQRVLAQQRRAQTLIEGARDALHDDRFLEARAKARQALELTDGATLRALWRDLLNEPVLWQQPVGALAYRIDASPDGSTIAVACQNQLVYLFDVRTSAPRLLRGHTDQVLTVAFSRDGNWLASGDWTGAIHIWDVQRGTLERVLSSDDGGIDALVFGPDGLMAGSNNGVIRRWNPKTGTELEKLSGHDRAVREIAFSGDNTRMVTLSKGDGTVRTWTSQGEPRQVLKPSSAPVSATFSPDGHRLAVGATDGVIRLYSAETLKLTDELRGHDGIVHEVRYNPEGNLLASAGADKTIRLWDPSSGELRRVFKGHSYAVRSMKFLPDGRHLVSASFDRSVRLWDLSVEIEPNIALGHTGPIYGVSFNQDSSWLATGGFDQTLIIWDVASGAALHSIHAHDGVIQSTEFHPSEPEIATSGNGLIRLWDANSGKRLRVFANPDIDVSMLRYDSSGSRLATGTATGQIFVLDSTAGTTQLAIDGHDNQVRDVQWSPDGRSLASTSDDGTARLWDSETGAQLESWSVQPRGDGLAFNSDGTLLAMTDIAGRIQLRDLARQSDSLLLTHGARTYGAQFHPDGEILAVASSDGFAHLWDITSRADRRLVGHRNEVNNVRYSRDGELLATISDDATVRLWDSASTRPVWRAPVMLPAPVRLLSHRGWERIDGQQPAATESGVPDALARALETRTRWAGRGAGADVLCMHAHDQVLELWRPSLGKQIARKKLPGLKRVVPTASGCAALTKTGAAVLTDDGAYRQLDLHDTPSAITGGDNTITLAVDDQLVTFDAHGNLTERSPGKRGAVALTRGPTWVAIGFADGNVELISNDPAKARPARFQKIPPSNPTAMLVGPKDTLVIGYANGVLGMWSAKDGRRIATGRLHGTVIHLLQVGELLYAATDLGTHLRWNIGALQRERCDLLREVWQRVPIVWEDGRSVVRAPNREHACVVADVSPEPSSRRPSR